MKRTQLYLQENIWKLLHMRSQQLGTSISELVRQAVKDKYANSRVNRREAMQAIVGMWKDRRDLRDSNAYIRGLRRGKKLRRIKA
jgi:hypothetical protein